MFYMLSKYINIKLKDLTNSFIFVICYRFFLDNSNIYFNTLFHVIV